MIQEDKELLLKDLCTRLSYGVKGLAYIVGEPCNTNTNIIGIINENIMTNYESPMLKFIDLSSKDIIIKPYLRPMSSMTEEEKKEYELLCDYYMDDKESKYYFNNIATIDWYHQKHFDCRGLIKLGLALEAPEGMYNLKEE